MMDWNPNNKRFLYFHFTSTDGRDEYLKVDSIEQKIYKVTLNSGSKSGRPYMRGLYELKWISFLSNYLHFGDEMKNRIMIQKFGSYTPYKVLKYTTENQYIEALKLIITDFIL